MKLSLLILVSLIISCNLRAQKSNINGFVSSISNAVAENSMDAKFSFEHEGTLILLPPYAAIQHFTEIKNSIGSQAAEYLSDTTGSKEAFWIALYKDEKIIDIQVIDPNTIFFGKMFLVKFKKGDVIEVKFAANKKIEDIYISP
jgi:hypothetical protein